MPSQPTLTIDRTAIADNWRLLAAASGSAATGAAIKADGYGLGAREVFDTLWKAGARDFFVAHWSEAAALGPLPEGARLAVLHGAGADDMDAALALGPKVVPVLSTPAQVVRWKQTGRPADVMLDTGFNRLGLGPGDIGVLEGLEVATLHSHLACADEPLHPLNALQLERFRAMALPVPAARLALANSAGIGLGADWHFGLTRPGIGLYGGGPSAERSRLRAVVGLAATVLQMRKLQPGDTVGYGADFVAARPMRLAVVALGYADGFRRALAPGAACMTADGVRCALVGRISMDLMTFDASAASLAEGDRVAVEFDLAGHAAASGVSQYELLVGLGHRYARCYR